MIFCCPAEKHAAIRADIHRFHEGTRPLGEASGLLYANCIDCNSTLALPQCCYCGVICPTGDALPWPSNTPFADEHVHLRCAVARMLAKGRVKFMVAKGRFAAGEMVTV